ncbi:hypothetical protein A3C91_01630 [Candidatus Azambacteria bacterium RIFCSPHIGHO2_02_FULL_52_12]|uniref:Uncharacterized protein n=1 Tax=Candidatus Azambacteria bacterium RIFCSPLOWO2_01_FULL_46_25 TaxID=1797298 RepID=A0A1F5BVB3_9BACT|nr:MAG: hypothetical protein A3C91_01630 [Candidatus Azambacteria bacterium RIFCSPHIGHO2_02_FULL_52_12]OGD34547.1 MAG: hypothetical protein A2988_03495 [Candidatus Azambacteria bacterium RIFCSPLOWO2_01_FULL_46_25]OGD36421.1 MAG: hypothetical protein A2850_01995 [Candidatus Azambacteria bacterium RIFCSPHIGHO2_01_FULL_51_74]
MPDISLLQREYDVAREESKTPGAAFTASLVVLLVSVGAYIGLVAYESLLEKRIETATQLTGQLKVGDAYKNATQLTATSRKVKTLKTLRESHTNLSQLLSSVERATHPSAFFNSGDLDAQKQSAELKGGTLPTAAMLVRQMDIYRASKDIADFMVDNIGYGEKHLMRFDATIHFK